MATEPLDPTDTLTDHELQSYVDGKTTFIDLYVMRLMARDLLACRRAGVPDTADIDLIRQHVADGGDFTADEFDFGADLLNHSVASALNALLTPPPDSRTDIDLRKALEPFAEFARATSFDKLPDDLPMTQGSRFARRQVTAGDFKKALVAFAKTEDR